MKHLLLYEAYSKPFDIKDVEIKDDHGGYITAFWGGKCIGKLVGVLSHDNYKKTVYVNNVEVFYPFKRSGVGRLLYDKADEYAKSRGLTLVPASSLSDAAFGFWNKWRPEAVADDGRHWDEHYMGKVVTREDGSEWKIYHVAGKNKGVFLGLKNIGDDDNAPTCILSRQLVYDQIGDFHNK